MTALTKRELARRAAAYAELRRELDVALAADQHVPCTRSERELWTSELDADQRRAAEACLGCAILDACFAYGLTVNSSPNHGEVGVYGGLTEADRRGSNWKVRARRAHRRTTITRACAALGSTHHRHRGELMTTNPDLHRHEMGDAAGLLWAEALGDHDGTTRVLDELVANRDLAGAIRLLYHTLHLSGSALAHELTHAAEHHDGTPPPSLQYIANVQKHLRTDAPGR